MREPSAAPVAKTYRTVLDGDSHRYLIPTARDEEWNQLVELGEFDEPEWAERIDGEAFDGLPADVANILLQALRECVDRRESCDDEPAYITRARAALAAATGAK